MARTSASSAVRPLRLVDGHGVAMVNVAGVEVAGRHDPVCSVGQVDGQRSRLRVERGDHASESVQQAV